MRRQISPIAILLGTLAVTACGNGGFNAKSPVVNKSDDRNDTLPSPNGSGQSGGATGGSSGGATAGGATAGGSTAGGSTAGGGNGTATAGTNGANGTNGTNALGAAGGSGSLSGSGSSGSLSSSGGQVTLADISYCAGGPTNADYPFDNETDARNCFEQIKAGSSINSSGSCASDARVGKCQFTGTLQQAQQLVQQTLPANCSCLTTAIAHVAGINWVGTPGQ
jgi:hypothetical protein